MCLTLASTKDLKAKDIMAGPVKTIGSSANLQDFLSEKVPGSAVIENGVFVGLITQKEYSGKNGSAAELMSCNFIPVQLTAPLSDLIEIILNNDRVLDYFLVENGKEPQGFIDVHLLLKKIWGISLETEAKLKAVLNAVHEAVTIIDNNEKVIGWNRQAEAMYGINSGLIIGKDIGEFFENLVVTRAYEEKKQFRDSYHQPRKNTHVLINAEPIKVGEKVIGGVSSERDITEMFFLHQELSRTDSQLRQLEKQMDELNGEREPFHRIIGQSKKIKDLCNMAGKVANTNATVLIRGESGTGKELFAEAIHRASPRRENPFIVVNCGAIPQTLFESELFGYVGGSFTGADKGGRIGKFEQAHQGTIFLDEIGELQLDMQVKLLRVLQNKVFYKVGGQDLVNVDVRVIAATNRNLEKMVSEGKFREDLYYRLNVVALDVLPLRERKEDIPDLVEAFMDEFCRLHNRGNLELAAEVMSLLLNYPWPGNIRQLRNVIERVVVLAEGPQIQKQHLPDEILFFHEIQTVQENATLAAETERRETEMILAAMKEFNGNKTKAAKKLGIPRSTLYYKLNTFKLMEGEETSRN